MVSPMDMIASFFPVRGALHCVGTEIIELNWLQHEEEELSEYEKRREQRIAENNKVSWTFWQRQY